MTIPHHSVAYSPIRAVNNPQQSTPAVSNSAPMFRDFLCEFRQDHGGWSATTWRGLSGVLRNLESEFGGTPRGKLTPRQIQGYLNQRRNGGPLTTDTHAGLWLDVKRPLSSAPFLKVEDTESPWRSRGPPGMVSDSRYRELDPLFQDKPKQMCPHPVAAVAWPYSEVKDHWDRLQIHSRVEVAGHVVTMQESPAAELVDLEYLLAMESVQVMPDPMILYCGAVPTLAAAFDTVEEHNLPALTTSGVGEAFVARLSDPVLGRSIEHRYRAVPLGDDLHER